VLTPNLDEAAVLTGTPVAKTLGELIEQGHALQALGPDFVVLKGGRGRGEQATDIVLQRGKDPSRMGSPRVATRNNHGTGCTHSAAITAHIAHDLPASDAIGLAKLYVAGAIEAADYLNVGLGHGPVHHFHRQWLDARKGETH
jgi:hydroxymethylpyrimidine/phosphomethylpyrimidine kinase